MASLTEQKGKKNEPSRWTVQFVGDDGKRRSV